MFNALGNAAAITFNALLMTGSKLGDEAFWDELRGAATGMGALRAGPSLKALRRCTVLSLNQCVSGTALAGDAAQVPPTGAGSQSCGFRHLLLA